MSEKSKVLSLLALINSAAQGAIDEYEKTGHSIPSLNSTAPHPLDTATETISLKKALRLLEGACDQLCATLAPPAHTIVNRGQDYEWSCLRVVTETCIADVLAGYPDGLHVNDLSEIVKIEKGKLARILRILATRHCFREVDTDVFANNRLSTTLLSSNNVSDFVRMLTYEGPKAASVFYETLTDAESGFSYEPSRSAYMYSVKDEGVMGSFFEWQKLHPERRETFGRAMIGMNGVMGSLDVLHYFPWKDIKTLCDIGSGVGGFSIALARAFPHINITLHDLPGTIDQARLLWTKELPEAIDQFRVNFNPLDFFVNVPVPGKDIYYLRNIIHNWPDAQAEIILRTVRRAMSTNSRLLIHEYIVQHLNRTPNQTDNTRLGLEVAPEPMLPNFGVGNIRSYNQDLTMLFMYNAKERTLNESVQLGIAAGLQIDRVWDLGETSLLVFRVETAE